ncbi:Golgi CORVET complex core vacuolar protein 8-domain-containing protein [Zopfochytrium polystomum]|nr:Golgi CORVET complex core vacuolar protein 8-domain-containing protein [Zopfochytrium polystomum]
MSSSSLHVPAPVQMADMGDLEGSDWGRFDAEDADTVAAAEEGNLRGLLVPIQDADLNGPLLSSSEKLRPGSGGVAASRGSTTPQVLRFQPYKIPLNDTGSTHHSENVNAGGPLSISSFRRPARAITSQDSENDAGDARVIELISSNGSMRSGQDGVDFAVRPTSRRTSSTNSLLQDPSVLHQLEERLESLIVNDVDLVNYPQILVQTTIDGLEDVRADILQYGQDEGLLGASDSSADGSFRKRKIEELLDRVMREVALCQQFLSKNDDRLSLRNILKGEDSDDELDDLVTRSPRGPPTDTTSISSLSNLPPEPYVLPSSPATHRLSLSSTGSVASRASTIQPANQTSAGAFRHANNLFNNSSGSTRLNPPGPRDIFRWTVLRLLSEQLRSDSMLKRVGIPTVMAVSGGIAVGTSRSIVLVFDLAQSLKLVLGDTSNALEYGSVTAITLALDRNRLASGYAKGYICVWDLQKKVCLKVIPPVLKPFSSPTKDGHAIGAKIIHLSFIGSRQDMISGDSDGSGFYHAFLPVAILNTVSSIRIHGLSQRPSVIFAIAVMPRGLSPHSTDKLRALAIAAPQKLLIICMKPTPAVMFKMPWSRKGSASSDGPITSASLAWRPSMKSGSSVTNPLLAVAFGSSIAIIEVSHRLVPGNLQDGLTFNLRGEWQGSDTIVAVRWINDQLLTVLSRTDILTVFDTYSMLPLEHCDVRDHHIACHDYFHSSEESPFEMAYHQTFHSYKGRLFLMGPNQIEVASPLSWNDRLTALARSGRFEESISMGLEFYSGQSQRAATGLPSFPEIRTKAVGTYLSELVVTYVRMAVSGHERGSAPSADDVRTFLGICNLCASACLDIGREDLLFGDIYDLCAAVDLQWILFEALEPHFLADRLTELNNPTIVQDIVAKYEERGCFERIEQLLLHLDPAYMDLNQVLRLCRSKNLYSALIFVYNRALRDFVTPIIELMAIVNQSLATPPEILTNSEESTVSSQCYTLYVYLAYVLTGKAYPIGLLAKKESLQAKTDSYNFLFSQKHISWPPGDSSALMVSIGREPYPYLNLLIQYDSREFCKVLGVALSDSSLNGEIRVRSGHAQDGRVRFADEHVEFSRQLIIDTLLSVIQSEVSSLPISHQMHLLAFIARSCAKYPLDIKLPNSSKDHILDMMIDGDDEDSHNERQVAILSFLPLRGGHSIVETEALLARCEARGFWKVAESIYRSSERYDRILRCYLKDSNRKLESFSCVKELLGSELLTYSQTWDVKQSFLENIAELVGIDPWQTAGVVMSLFPGENADIIRVLETDAESLFKYMRGVLALHIDQSGESAALSEPKKRGSMLNRRATVQDPTRIQRSSWNSAPSLSALPSPHFSTDMYNRYIELMIQFDATSVLSFLKELSGRFEKDPYDFVKVLELCRSDSRVSSAALWMLERSGQISEALDILQAHLESGLNAHASSGDEDVARTALREGIELCRRSSTRCSEKESESFWFSLFDQLTARRNAASALDDRMEGKPGLVKFLNELLHILLAQIMGQVQLPTVLNRLVTRTEPVAEFGEFRYTIMTWLESAFFNLEIALSANRCLSKDTHAMHRRLQKARSVAISPTQGSCEACRRPLHVDVSEGQVEQNPPTARPLTKPAVLVFQCGHAFHGSCLELEMRAGAVLAAPAVAAIAEDWEEGLAWCAVCEIRNEAGVRAAKKRSLESAASLRGARGKRGVLGAELTPLTEEESRLERVALLYEVMDRTTSASAIFKAGEQPDFVEEDKIEMNDGSMIIGTDGQAPDILRGSDGEVSSTALHSISSSVLDLLPRWSLDLAPP